MSDPVAAVARQIADHLGASQGVADEHGILYIEPIKDGSDIVGESVEIVTAAGIIGTPMTATVECHATPTSLRKCDERDIPPVGAESPWSHEDYRPSRPPIPKVNFGSIVALDHGAGA